MPFNSSSGSLTSSTLRSTWSSPREVLTIVLILGADVIQKALAQTTGTPGILTPVCFSFGWVAYAFTALINLMGSGRLLPNSDYHCKVVCLQSGYARDNYSWAIGRVIRRLEMRCVGAGGLTVEVFDAVGRAEWSEAQHRAGQDNGRERGAGGAEAGQRHVYAGRPVWGYTMALSYSTIAVQLGIAAIPLGLYGNWGVFLIAAIGQGLVFITGALPQWRIEKLACRKGTKKNIAVTRGNGSKYVAVILGNGVGLDLEDLSTAESPRMLRSWERHGFFVKRAQMKSSAEGSTADEDQRISESKIKVLTWASVPLDLWVTRIICLILAFLWVALLICVTAIADNAWYLMAVGALGMAQNALVAGMDFKAERYGIHLKHIKTLSSTKVMDTLKDLETEFPGNGKALVHEFFPGMLRPDEIEWWDKAGAACDELKRKKKEEEEKTVHEEYSSPNNKTQTISP